MKVLVATQRTQGEWCDDYNDCICGELVCWAEPCPVDIDSAGCADVCSDACGDVCTGCRVESCGYERAFDGLSSDQSTTTAEIVELSDFSAVEYLLALQSSFARRGVILPRQAMSCIG